MGLESHWVLRHGSYEDPTGHPVLGICQDVGMDERARTLGDHANGVWPESGILTYLAGGLGNQIFMASTAWALALRLGVPICAEISYFSTQTLREPEILQTGFPFFAVSSSSRWGTVAPLGRRIPYPVSNVAFQWFPLLETNHRLTKYQLRVANSSRTLFGYFQSFEFFHEISPLVETALNSSTISNRARGRIEALNDSSHVILHLRRGDLMGSVTGQVLNLWIGLQEAEELAKTMGKNRIVVFTDSPNEVRSEIEESYAGVVPVQIFDAAALTSVETLICMSHSDAFVVGSSTFGFWATWLAVQRQGDSVAIRTPATTRQFWRKTAAQLPVRFF